MRRALAGALLAVASALAGAAISTADPVEPDTLIRHAQRRVQRYPLDPGAYHRLGDAYIQKARASGDPSYFVLAEQALKRSLAINPGRAGVWRHLAYVAASRHDFREALAHAARAVELDPADADARGVLGDALLELGRYDAAEDAYRKMTDLDSSLASHARTAGLKNLRGDVRGAIKDLELAVELGQANQEPRESVAWAQWQLASEHLGVGDLAVAEARFTAALATQPNYYRALAGLAQVRATQQRFPEAVDLYRKSLAVIPLPEHAAAFGDLLTTVGRHDEARKQYDLVEYIGRLSALNQAIYNRELALFYADHDMKLPEALGLARKELEVRQDVFAYDLLAWALLKNGRASEAVAPMREALRLGTRDARMHFHAGMIHRALGDREKAREHLREALALNPSFNVLQAKIAEQALRELAHAEATTGDG